MRENKMQGKEKVRVTIGEVLQNRYVMAGAAVVVVVFGVLVLWRQVRIDRDASDQLAGTQEETRKERRLIDGVLVSLEEVDPPIAGVMIENMIEAQPISGLAEARLVFEAITEADITRFLAYFVLPSIVPSPGLRPSSPAGGGKYEEKSIEIGPVRSARPYFLDFAAEFDTLYAHVGGSPAAYNILRGQGVEGIYDLDQWYHDQYFWRTYLNGRRAPHNVYTSLELLGKAFEEIFPERRPLEAAEVEGPSTSSSNKKVGFEPWQFKNDAPPDLRGDVSDIAVEYEEPYKVRWLYDKSENHYKRIQWGGVHKDAQGEEIIVKNIAVAFQEMKILDTIGRKEFKTIGEGEALVFQDGRVTKGIWKKSSARERMRFYDAYDKEVEFNAGVTWVEIVPSEYAVKY